MDRKTLVSASIMLFCSIGLIFHVNEVSLNYFKFETESKVSITTHNIIDSPMLSACFRGFNILKLNEIKKDLGIDMISPTKQIHESMYARFTSQIENFTVKNFLDYTPKTNEVRYVDIKNHTY